MTLQSMVLSLLKVVMAVMVEEPIDTGKLAMAQSTQQQVVAVVVAEG